jgi:16S rRNA (uracil1498-N3)-methyltransferase
MSYFISERKLIIGEIAEISGHEASHILLSRRTKVGDEIAIQDILDNRFRCLVESINKNRLSIKPLSLIVTPIEPSLQVILLQAMVSEQALDLILQKGTELGAGKIILFQAEFSPNSHATDKKLERWRKICLEAAKQSDRLKPPTVEILRNLEEVIEFSQSLDKTLFLDVDEKDSGFKDISVESNGHIGIIIGPEGGFSDKELKQLRSNDFIVPIHLGPRILRAETAAIASLAIVQNLFGDVN